MSDGEAESSSQALEAFLTGQLAKLSIQLPKDEIEFMSQFLEEEGMERADKIEGVKGMLEGVIEGVSQFMSRYVPR